MGVVQMLNDLKAHFEQGKELLESHLPGLVDLAARLEDDPFVQTAINTALSPGGKAIVTELIGKLEALEADHAAAGVPAPDPASPAPQDPDAPAA